jgi:hypothetical protein
MAHYLFNGAGSVVKSFSGLKPKLRALGIRPFSRSAISSNPSNINRTGSPNTTISVDSDNSPRLGLKNLIKNLTNGC